MVKKIILILFVLVFFVGCKRTIVERENSIVVYKNFLYIETIPFDASILFKEIELNKIDDECLSKEKHLNNQLKRACARYFLAKYKLCAEESYRNLMGADNVGYVFDTIKTSYNIYAYGKMNHHKNVVSYIVLFQSSKDFLPKDIYSELVAFTVQNNNLQSIVVLYKGSKDPDFYQKTYYNKGLFTTLLSSNGPSDMSYDVEWLKIRSWYEFKLKIGLESYHQHMISYSNFYLDAIGYVRFTHLKNYKVPDLVVNEMKK